MSLTISRNDFARQFAADGGHLNVNDMDPELRASLTRAGVSREDLAHIAGRDGQIAGRDEWQQLFDGLDRLDGGSRNTLSLVQEDGVPTLPGTALEQLRAEIARNRLAASSSGIIHIGMNKASSAEVDALRAVTPKSVGGVYAIDASASSDVVELDGQEFDLRDDARRADFVRQLSTGSVGMDSTQAGRFADVLKDSNIGTADELAQLGLALFRAGKGELPVNRLVLSGHGAGTSVYGDNGSVLKHLDIRLLAAEFPEGARKIEHIAFSSCFSGSNPGEWRDFRAAFPNLRSLFGYAEFSPSVEQGSPRDLRRWSSQSDGDDPSRMDPFGRSVATWNIADGEQKVPRLDAEARAGIIARADQQIEKYRASGPSATSARDPAVRRAYVEVMQALNSEGLSEAELKRLEKQQPKLYDLRHL